MLEKISRRKPKNLLDYFKVVSLDIFSNDLLRRVWANGDYIIRILKEDIDDGDLKVIKFILKLNNFDCDLEKIIFLMDRVIENRRSVDLRFLECEKYFLEIDAADLLLKANCFYRVAWCYDENFTSNSFVLNLRLPTGVSRKTFFMDESLSYCENISKGENLYNFHLFFNRNEDYLINFINTFYGDGLSGEKFLRKSFVEVMVEYGCLSSIGEELRGIFDFEIASKERVESEYYKDMEDLMAKHPATIYKAIVDLLGYVDKKNH